MSRLCDRKRPTTISSKANNDSHDPVNRPVSMSSTTTVLSSQQHAFRLSPALSNRSHLRIRHTPYQVQRPQRTAGPGQPSLDAPRPEMSSTAYYGQRPVSYETGARRDSYIHAGAPAQRSWTNGRDGQSWQEDYHQVSSQNHHQQRQYQSSQQHVPPQARLSVSGTASHVSRHSTRPSTPNSGYSSHTASAASTSGDASMVKHSLQIPARISPKGGNLADFSAQVGSNV